MLAVNFTGFAGLRCKSRLVVAGSQVSLAQCEPHGSCTWPRATWADERLMDELTDRPIGLDCKPARPHV